MKKAGARFQILASLLLFCGCASPTTHSVDAEANYHYVFSDVNEPKPTIVHSHVERWHRSVFGVLPLSSQHNGDWEFELVASRPWLEQVKKAFTETPFEGMRLRPVPDWFSPTVDGFTAWQIQGPSIVNAQLFIEKNPSSQEQTRVFICRH